jgi:hypothetical protein
LLILLRMKLSEFLEALQKKRQQTVVIFLGIMAVTGGILFASFVYPPSEAGKQFFFGLSRERFSIAVIFLIFLLINIGAVFLSVKRWRDIETKMELLVSNNSAWILTALYFLMLTMEALLLLTVPRIPVSLVFLEPVRVRLLAPIAWLFLVSTLLIVLIRFLYAGKIHSEKLLHFLNKGLLVAGIFLFTFFFYEHYASWIGWVNKIKYSYWNLLAGEFLHGRLFLNNPPANPHDLTLYNGKWYVPSPPLPAILMMPLAYLVGAEKISTADFSMFFSAINAVLVFLILDQFIQRQWIKLSRNSALCLVLLFAFGTPHLWVGISGRFWFVSQILTVTFLAFAVLAALKSWSPWIIGICIGLAVGARPNGLMTWPFVFAIAMQIMKEKGQVINFNRMFAWSLKSAIPIGIAVMGLLLYNHARFENYLDFGYVTINGDPTIVQNAQTHGLFSTYYIPYNLRVMFLYVPKIHWGERWPILPSGTGMSIFLTTPALLYLLHRYEGRWWIFGAWTTVLFNFILLILYHNTGKDQFGYRYILDVLVPLIALLAASLGKKIPWHFIVLLILSILINLYGTNWFMNG